MLNIFPRLCFKGQISYIRTMSKFSSEQLVTNFLGHLTTLHQLRSLNTTVAYYYYYYHHHLHAGYLYLYS